LRIDLGIERIGRILIAALVVSAMSRAQEPPLGVVQQANRAHVGQSDITEGATVFTAEELSTDAGGVLAVSIDGAGFRLLESSRVFFYHGANGPIAELRAGTLAFRKEAGGGKVTIVASDVRVVSKDEGPVTGQVMIASPCEIRVTSVVGQLDVTSGQETRTVGERESYSVTPEVSVFDARSPVSPDDSGYHQSHSHRSCAAERPTRKFGGPPLPSGSSHFLKIALIAGGVGAIIALLPKGHSESPSVP
jgi:hypothetical protein